MQINLIKSNSFSSVVSLCHVFAWLIVSLKSQWQRIVIRFLFTENLWFQGNRLLGTYLCFFIEKRDFYFRQVNFWIETNKFRIPVDYTIYNISFVNGYCGPLIQTDRILLLAWLTFQRKKIDQPYQ